MTTVEMNKKGTAQKFVKNQEILGLVRLSVNVRDEVGMKNL